VAQIFVHQLQYLRDGVRLLDLAGGSFAELLAREGDAALVLFEARRYSRLALELARAAREAGVPVTLVTDPYCDWGREVATEVFMVPTAFDLFWESNAQMASLANLLVNGAFLELGPAAEVRMARVSDLHGRFIGHVRGAR
jgi:DNA-binding MurR/RpiR family transcriptional regulator